MEQLIAIGAVLAFVLGAVYSHRKDVAHDLEGRVFNLVITSFLWVALYYGLILLIAVVRYVVDPSNFH